MKKLTVLLVLVMLTVTGCFSDKGRKAEILNSFIMGQVVTIDSGFYKGCEGILQERVSHWTFRVLVLCNFGVEANVHARDFSPELRELE